MSGAPGFIPGRELSRTFFDEVVSPIIDRGFPRLAYAAGLLGPGSDVLGFDTARSMDHDWGPRCTLILSGDDVQAVGPRLRDVITESLPLTFRGHPVMYQSSPTEPDISVPAVVSRDAPVFHRVEITSLRSFLGRMDYEPGDEDDVAFWLTVTEQQLLECTSGIVFRDDQGEYSAVRELLAYFPDDIWRYRMAAMWRRIAQIEPFVGRTGEVGDAVGSFVIGASLVEDIMRLAMLQARQYAPYSKWLGTAVYRLDGAPGLHSYLKAAQTAMTWQAREAAIVSATSSLVQAHNRLGLTPHIDPGPRSFHNRPFTVIDADRVSDALMASLVHSPIFRLPASLGGVDQFIDSTDGRGNIWLRRVIRDAMHQLMRASG